MKLRSLLPVTAVALLSTLPAVGQSTFTRITTGPIATEGKYSNRGVWVDYDNDGDLDLFVANGGFDYPLPAKANYLYRNDGSGTFTKITTGAIVEDVEQSVSAAWGDYDNDGNLDLFVANLGAEADWSLYRNSFYRNLGDGTFTKVTTTPLDKDGGYHMAGSWADYDNDGHLDLLVANWSGPRLLYHNNGDANFTRITEGVLVTNVTAAHGAVWADYDNDGDVDLFVPNSEAFPFVAKRNSLYRNEGGGTFTPITTGHPVQEASLYFSGAWGDYDNDGDLDLYVCYGMNDNRNFLFQNKGDGTFGKITNGVVLSTQGGLSAAWGDYDNDGFLDLFLADGLVGNRLFHNSGNGTFTQIATGPGADIGYVSLGCDWGDYDDDGFLDLFVANATMFEGQSTQLNNFLYRNNGNTNRWLKVKLVGTVSNRAAIGAKVRVLASLGGTNLWQLREISVGCNYSGHNLLPHFGLGDATNVDLVRIEWPSGNVQELVNLAPNQSITVTEATLITPTRPTASLNGSVTLSRTALAGATYQWRLDGVDLVGQTNRILNLTSITADMAGRYSIVVSNETTLTTNFVYLLVDTQFTKITQGAVVNDPGNSYVPTWGDYNGDGWLDLFVANGGNEGPSLPFIYRNDQLGGFVRVSQAEVGDMALDRVQACEGIWADYDNDGDQDLFIGSSSLSSPNRFYLNDGNNRFVRVTNDVGINRALYPWGSAWADFDNDGLVDLYMASGWLSSGTKDSLWRNLGNGSFQQCKSIMFPAMDVNFGAWGDADNDGDLELLVGGAGSSYNAFFRNNGDGTFITDPSAGLGGGQACMPVWADFNNDGYLDVFLAHPSVPCYYYLNNKNGTFQRITTGPHTQTMGIIATAGDFDNDGDIDLFITRGAGNGDPSLFFRNEGDGTFVSITCGSLTQDRGHFSDCAWADYDNDGALDLVVTTVANEKNSLFHNNGNSNGWLIVRLVGTRSNRDAIGAKVRAGATVWGRSTMQTRQIGGGALGDPRAHFGLGNATKVTTLRIEWPSGAIQQFQNVATNQILTVWEPPVLTGAIRADGACELTIKAEPNRGWQIQASSDLLTWQTLTTVTNTTFQFQFTDLAAAGMNCRFYRVESK